MRPPKRKMTVRRAGRAGKRRGISPQGTKLDGVADKGFPWAPGTATGIGSMPGDNPLEAQRVIVDELPGFPYLAELPARGPGADIIGRAAALLVDIPAEVTVRGWRIAERPGRDLQRARSMLSSGLDALEETLTGYEGLVKVQIAGPWTLAATLEQPRSLSPALADPGLVADLASSLAEGAAAHVADAAKRLPRARLVVQFDEPALPAVIAGAVPTPSGLSRVRVVEEEVLRERLHEVLTAVAKYTVVHCCDHHCPFGLIEGAGADAVAFDLGQLRREDYDPLATVAEAGLGLLAGIRLDDAERSRPSVKDDASSVARMWRTMALPPGRCAQQVVITPACGLAGASPDRARDALRRCHQAARILPEMMEEVS
jgi:methionine synthase II (cobalamin-independent)